jgi:hypothetical protein
LNYQDGQIVRIGDKVLLGDDEGVVVFSIDTDEFSVEFPKEDWVYLGKGVMFQTAGMGLVFQEESSTDLELLQRA